MMVQEYWPGLLTVYLACLVAFTSPGPNFVAITSYAVKNRAAGYGVAVGISVGTAIWALFAATGLTALVTTFRFVETVIGVAGGLYLLWLGYNAFKSVLARQTFQPNQIDTKDLRSLAQSVLPGLAIQLSNPKTAMFWLALTSTVIQPGTPYMVIVLLVGGCLMLALLWHCLLAFAFSSGPLREAYIRYKPVFSLIFAVLFCGFGLSVFYSLVWGQAGG